MIPRLPPKQLMLDSLLEERRRGLQRWLRICAKHPVLGADPLLAAFLSDTGAAHLDNLRLVAAREPDEFARLAGDVTLPLADQGRLAASRESMRTMLTAVGKLRRLAEQQATRVRAQAADVAEMAGVLRLAGGTTMAGGDQTAGDSEPVASNAFAPMADGFAAVAALAERCAQHQQSAVGERFDLLTDILVSHSDLCDRVEKGIVSDHQRAMSRMLSLNAQRVKGVIRGTAVRTTVRLRLAAHAMLTRRRLHSRRKA